MLKSKFTFKRVLLFIVMLTGFVLLAGCAKKADSITLSDSSLTLTVGEKQIVTATVLPEDVKSEVTWESDDPDVATVSSTGEITAIAAGTATITATIDEKSATVAVTVELEKFDVTFESNGGSNVAKLSVSKGAKAAKPTDPTQTGLVFKGWFTDEDLTEAFDWNTAITENVTLYAKWEAQKLTIEFETNGGSAVEDAEFNYGSRLSTSLFSNRPTKTGYVFDGWYLDEDLEEPIDFTVNVTEGFTAYAKWKPRAYTITFDENYEGGLVRTVNVNYTEKLAMPSNTLYPIRTGYFFAGWYKDAETTVEYNFNELIPAEDFTLYAKWTPGTGLIDVVFNANDGTEPTIVFATLTEKLTKPANPERTGYDFKGWFTDAALTKEYDFDTPVAGPFTLYGKWELPEDESTLIEFDMNEGYWPITSANPLIGVPQKAEHNLGSFGHNYWGLVGSNIFLWRADIAGGNYAWALKVGLKLQGNGLYEVTKIIPGASTSTAATEFNGLDYWFVAHGDYAAGYSFLNNLAVGDVIVITGFDITLATPAALTDCKVHVYPQGTLLQNPVRLTKGAELPKPAKMGYKFDGWYSDEEFEDLVTEVPDSEEKVTLYAKWVNAPVVTFDTNGGSEVPAQVINGVTATKPTNPTKPNFLFVNWYYYTAEGAKTYFNFGTVVTEDITLYAEWTTGVQITLLDGTKEIGDPFVINKGAKLTKPANPTKAKFLFENWYIDAGLTTLYDFDQEVNNDLVLFANWNDAVEIKLMDGDVALADPYLSLKDEKLDKPANPEKKGYYFEDWYVDEDLETKFDFENTNVDKDLTLYAKWSEPVTIKLFDGETAFGLPISHQSGKKFAKPATPTKDGHIFEAWCKDEELKVEFDFENEEVTEDLNLYIKWAETVTVTLKDGENIIGDPFVSKKGEKLAQPANPTKTNYVFKGWYSDEDLEKEFKFDEVELDKDITLYAKFEQTTFTITYNTNEGVLLYNNKAEMVEAFLKDFYEFVEPGEDISIFMHGVGKSEGFNGTWYSHYKLRLYDGARPTEADEDKDYFLYQPEYYEKWLPFFDTLDTFAKLHGGKTIWNNISIGLLRMKQYIVNEKPVAAYTDAEMAMLPSVYTVKYTFTKDTDTFLLHTEIVREGYVFGGWYTKSDFSGSAVTQIAKGTEANVVLYAKWTAEPAE